MGQFIQELFSPNQYMPHGACYLWQTPLVWLHVVSDLLIAIAYFSIPIMLIYFVYKRGDVPFLKVFILFGAFIVLCGTGHILDIWTLWHPVYWLSGAERALTALVSCYTALQLVTLLPQFLALRTPEQLAIINQELEKQIAFSESVRQEQHLAEQTLKSVVAGTASVIGEAFFPALVENLALALGVRYAFVTEVVGYQPRRLKSLAFWANGQLEERFEVELANSPCQPVIEHAELCYYPDQVQTLFPNATALQEMAAVSYLGAPLLTETGHVIGVLCIYHDCPLPHEENAKAIITAFAIRAATELQRQRAELALRQAYDELETRVQERTAELITANVALETEIQDRKGAEIALRDSRNRLRKQQAGVLWLARSKNLDGNLDDALKEITQLATRILNTQRGSAWLYNPDQSELHCADLYDLSKAEHRQEPALRLNNYPSYFKALATNQVIAAHHAYTDSRTQELGTNYLALNAIASKLDVPIRLKGKTVGVFCLEEVGTVARRWTIEEQNFASYLAYMIALTMESRDRKQAEFALRQSEAQLRQQTQQLEQTLQELQQAQAQLIHSEKISSLGMLVAGVAHEINNPINFIHGNLDPAREYVQDLLNLLELYQAQSFPPSAEIQTCIEEIDLEFLKEDVLRLLASMRVGTDRIRSLVQSLRTFSRLDEAGMKAVDVHEGIDSTLVILGNRLKATADRPAIEVVKEYGNLPLIECYAGQLNQVFMNILSNAVDALEEATPLPLGQKAIQGDVDFDYGNVAGLVSMVDRHPPQICIRTELLRSNWVAIRIIDNGPGITESLRQKLFNPFFTTKPAGKGTGMGLAISYQIVTEKHRGQLRCISQPNHGAEFVIEIPIRQHLAPGAVRQPPAVRGLVDR
jgi:signal transduction histidine kinase